MCYAPETPPAVTWITTPHGTHSHAIWPGHTNEARTRTLCGRTPLPPWPAWPLKTDTPTRPICTLCWWSYSARTGFTIEHAGEEIDDEPQHQSHQP